MKSSIVLGLGLLTLGTGAALVPALANGQRSPGRSPRTQFSADVRGAHAARLNGRVSLGPVGQPGEPGSSYTITLGADDAEGVIVLTRLGASPIVPGRYAIGESTAVDAAGGFRVLYLAGTATRPEGVFRGDAGTLEIIAAPPGQVGGRFELSATGFLADQPDDETRAVNITGAFSGVRYVP